MALPLLYMVIPCYNEEAVLPMTSGMFLAQLRDMIDEKLIDEQSRILFVNDGSKDNTWQIICDLARSDPHYIGICQSRNRGHQNAVLAGLMEAKDHCDLTISIDCDGQDDVRAMTEMVKAYHEGAEVVYGVRSARTTDTFFKRFTAEGFYRLLKWMGAEVVFNHADYRLISNRVLREFANFHEVNLFLRGMVPLVGFKSASVYYERHERLAGESHYPLKKMLALAFDGITSLSIKPIRLVFGIGCVLSGCCLVLLLAFLIARMAGAGVTDLAFVLSLICFWGGVMMICMGVVGEYVGKTYMEVKARPRYIISARTEDKGEESCGQWRYGERKR